MSARLEHLDQLIAESEQRITEQLFRVMALEARGKAAVVAKRLLKNLEAIHVEAVAARKAIADGLEAARKAGPI